MKRLFRKWIVGLPASIWFGDYWYSSAVWEVGAIAGGLCSAAQRGYCRSGFPPAAKNGWTQHIHEWEDKAEELFQSKNYEVVPFSTRCGVKMSTEPENIKPDRTIEHEH